MRRFPDENPAEIRPGRQISGPEPLLCNRLSGPIFGFGCGVHLAKKHFGIPLTPAEHFRAPPGCLVVVFCYRSTSADSGVFLLSEHQCR